MTLNFAKYHTYKSVIFLVVYYKMNDFRLFIENTKFVDHIELDLV